MNWANFNLIAFGVSITILSLYLFRKVAMMQNQSDEIGNAILTFGKAFPGEPIREVQPTADFGAVFLRLSDGKTGCIQSFKRHSVCRILKPGTVNVEPAEVQGVIHIEFGDSRLEDGDFRFRSEGDAAEVSLWLLGSIAAANDAEKAGTV
ncbi:hypothetical protein [Rhizobium sp. L1K21]|uniref:hypothetical protein n=1 Tax=Rhizobium sp. L1K21 TaxID=2954933 RepID=UPI0020929847|nr:hypothetical protein [Rhizobium sp. L1K21]MCO6186140.1 hypothetical protein [Rhizobium sp. L1K21]